MIQYGCVLENSGDQALVRLGRGDCANCCGCVEGLSEKKPDIWVENPVNAKSGQKVSVEFDSKEALLSAGIIFLIPVFSLILGVFSGYIGARSYSPDHMESLAFLCGIIFLLISVSGIALLDRKLRGKTRKGPKILEILSDDGCER